MRYALAFLCPPIALLACRRWYQAIPAAVLFGLVIATAKYGVGAVVDFFLILWASHEVGAEDARRESSDFVRTVKPVPVIRD